MTPLGNLFILGGLVLASYYFKAEKEKPVAAFDTFKPNVAIVFATGDSRGAFKQAAERLGFHYINVHEGMKRMDALVKSGETRFFVEGFESPEALRRMETEVVQPDVLMRFGEQSEKPGLRVVDVTNKDQIEKVLKERNLV